jgi:hypothetical protein
MKFSQPLFAMAAMALTTHAFAQSAAPKPAREGSSTCLLTPAGKVLGLGIHNDTEKNLGEIGDLLIDPRSGEIRYAVLEVGGFLGMNEDKRVQGNRVRRELRVGAAERLRGVRGRRHHQRCGRQEGRLAFLAPAIRVRRGQEARRFDDGRSRPLPIGP